MGDSSPYTSSTKKWINQSPESLKQYFAESASKLINIENVSFGHTKLATIIPEQECDGAFVKKHSAFTEVNKFIFDQK